MERKQVRDAGALAAAKSLRRADEIQRLMDWRNLAQVVLPAMASHAGVFLYHDRDHDEFVYYDDEKQVRTRSLATVFLWLLNEADALYQVAG